MARWRPTRRRSTVTTVLTALVTAGAVLAPAVAAAAGAQAIGAPATMSDAQAATASSQWLARQLTDGAFANPLNPTLPDYGLATDAVLALYASGDGSLAAPIVDRLDGGKEARRFFTYFGFGEGQTWLQNQGLDDRIGGATAKILVTAEVSGHDPRAFGGYDMVRETLGLLTPDGPEKGRVRDYGPTTSSNEANTFGQALAVLGLAGVRSNDRSAIDMLLWQQCSAGYFRIFYSAGPGGPQTCDAGTASGASGPDRDSTGLALSALIAARRAGATGLDAPIRAAAGWLVGQQTAGGGWGGGVSTEAPNSNSTGLVLQGLADEGAGATVIAKGAAYLRAAQATEADVGALLEGDVGAIGYRPEDLAAARTTGITARDAWIRSSTQASLGLSRASFWALVTGAVPQHGQGGGTPTPTPTPTPGPTPAPTPTPAPPAPVRAAPALTPGPTASAAPGPTPAGPTPSVASPLPAPLPAGTTPTGPPPKPNAPSAPNVATGSATPAGRLARFLAASLVGGDHVEVTSGPTRYVDYDATADIVLALRALGEQPATVARATAFLMRPASVAAYAHGAPYERGPAAYAAPLAKLAIIAELFRRDGAAPGDITSQIAPLVRSLEALQGADGTFEDTGTYADRTDTVARHAWATMAVTALGAAVDADRAASALVQRQCADGGFAPHMVTVTCATGDPAATGWAAQALDTVRVATTPAPTTTATALDSATTGGAVPAGWDEQRVTAVRRAAALLHGIPSTTGLVIGRTGTVDLAATAVVAAGRQAVGLDASDTARSLGGLQRADGGLAMPTTPATPTTTASDRALTLAAADGLAGRSWTGTTSSPLVTGLRVLDVSAPAARPTALSSANDSWWRGPWALLLVVIAAFVLGAAAHRLLGRRPTTTTSRPVLQTREEPS